VIHVELIGCTGAGKSTLLTQMLRACHDRGIEAWAGDDFVLSRVGAHRLTSRVARTLLVDSLSLLACLRSGHRNRHICLFAMRVVWRVPAPRLQKLNLARNVMKKIGVYEIIRARKSRPGVVIVDEGTLHAAHNLFVHLSVPPNRDHVATFADAVPLPDVAVHVAQRPSVLIERTLARGHSRIPARNRVDVECFVLRALVTFETLGQHPAVESRLVRVNPGARTVAAPSGSADPRLAAVANLVRQGLATNAAMGVRA
jgi:hypothetical protein